MKERPETIDSDILMSYGLAEQYALFIAAEDYILDGDNHLKTADLRHGSFSAIDCHPGRNFLRHRRRPTFLQ